MMDETQRARQDGMIQCYPGEIVAVTGGREYAPTPEEVYCFTVFTEEAAVIRHGDCRGLDRIIAWHAKRWQKDRDPDTIQAWPADWAEYGPAAGPIRNREMLTGFRAGVVVAPPASVLLAFPGGRGTASAIDVATSHGVKVVHIAELVEAYRAEART